MTGIKPSEMSPATTEAFRKKLSINTEYWDLGVPINGSTVMPRVGNSFFEFEQLYLKHIALVLLDNDINETAVLATYQNPTIAQGAILDGSAGQVMVRIPKIYYKEELDSNGILVLTGVSATPKLGYKLHEKFGYELGRDYIYIGAYEASNSGGNVLQSVSGVPVLAGVDLATFRSRAVARGTGWYNFDFYTQHLIQLLFYTYYANLNSQEALPGYTEHLWVDANKRNTGRSNTLTVVNGSVNSDAAGVDIGLEGGWLGASRVITNRFLFIENIFGHVWKMLDGCTFDGRIAGSNSVLATPNPTLFSSDTATILANYTNLNVALPAASNENYIQNLQGLFLPKTHGGSSSTYITDYFWSYLDDASRDYFRLVISGGALANSAPAGLASRDSLSGLGLASSDVGSRLCAAKN